MARWIKPPLRLINILLGNDEAEAVIEMHFPAPEILFEQETFFALGGANFGAKLNDEPIENWKIHFAESQSVLKFTKKDLRKSVLSGCQRRIKNRKMARQREHESHGKHRRL